MLKKTKAQNDIEMGPLEKVEEVANGECNDSADDNSPTCKQWEILDGNFRFLWDGRIMYGPGSCHYWLFIILHLIATLVVFLCFDIFPYIQTDTAHDYIVPVFLICLSLFAIYNIVRVVLTEPGYIPRPPVHERGENLLNYFLLKKRGQPVLKKIVVDGVEIEQVFCEECCDFRDPRAHHCVHCDACIERFDHHCGIFGTCIGRRNYGAFLRFLFATNFLFLLVGTSSLTNLLRFWLESGFVVAAGKSPTIFVLLTALVIPPLGILQLFFLLVHHAYLLMVDQTSLESTTKTKTTTEPDQRTRFQILRARLFNAYNLLVRAPPKSQINLRSIVKMEDTTFLKTLRQNYKERKTRTVFSCPNTGDDAGDLSGPGKKRNPPKKRTFAEQIRNLRQGCSPAMTRNRTSPGGRVFPE